MRQSLAHPVPALQLPVERLARLRSEDVRYVFIHTAAYAGTGCDAVMIDRWHRERTPDPFLAIGYHRVILNGRHGTLPDGWVQEGRPLDRVGAHVVGINDHSIGICVVGDGDREPFTEAQMESLVAELAWLLARFPQLTPDQVLGHREVNELVEAGGLDAKYRTTKTCPGLKVDMDEVRARLWAELNGEVPPFVINSPAPTPEVIRTPVKQPVANRFTHRKLESWEAEEEIYQAVIEEHPDVQQPEGLTLRRAWVILRDIVTAVDRWARVHGEATGADKMEIAIQILLEIVHHWGGMDRLRSLVVGRMDEKPLGKITAWAARKLLTDRVIERGLRWLVELAVTEIRELGGGTRRK